MASVPSHLTSPMARRAPRSRTPPESAAVIVAMIVAIVAACGYIAAAGTSAATGAAEPVPAQPLAAPRRIVSFVPAVTEMLFAIGAGPRVVGVSDYDRFPADVLKLPKVGGLLDPSLERVLALRPDLVITYATQRDLRTQLTNAQLPQFAYVHRDLADVTATIRSLGERVGVAAEADRVASRIDTELADIRRRAAGRPRPTTLLVFGRESHSLRRIHASGGYGFLHDLLEVAGGNDVMSDVRRESVELSTETILARAPEVIIELKYGARRSAAELSAARRDWNVLASVPAVRQHRVHVLQGDEFVVPGPRVILAARQLADALQAGR